ncbi:hypothetical protein KUTeg_005523 [Tegillarca granosa]|uniref:Uncharacterized protein n=1 Tax=Tegillarca granosa TaxID=220873 RepID=A0ABQ9FK04_TEGGR|nr:hypothetical protein KUTeg_005523 [Tegillarca granosa]
MIVVMAATTQQVEFERIRQSGRERLLDLSKPKEPKIAWWTNVGSASVGFKVHNYCVPFKIYEITSNPKYVNVKHHPSFENQTCEFVRSLYFCRMEPIDEETPNVMWGTQEMLWPIPKKSLQAEASQRITELSTPKKNFQTGNHAGRICLIINVAGIVKSTKTVCRIVNRTFNKSKDMLKQAPICPYFNKLDNIKKTLKLTYKYISFTYI